MNGVYRTPGRIAEPVYVAVPSARMLLGPIKRTTAFVFFTVAPVALFNGWIVPSFILAGHPDHEFVPTFDFIQDGIAIGILASLVLLLVSIVRRVRPSWGGLRLRHKILYVGTMLVVQSVVVVTAEGVLFQSRGGLHLFEPTLKRTFFAPDGRSAFLYREGFGCGYQVELANPFSLTMSRVLDVNRNDCQEPLPNIEWKADGTVGLIDATGNTLVSQPSKPLFSWWGGGC